MANRRNAPKKTEAKNPEEAFVPGSADATTPEEESATEKEAPKRLKEAERPHGLARGFGKSAAPAAVAQDYKFYPFEHEQKDEDTILSKTAVFRVFTYPGSERKGASLAYPANTLLPSSILDQVDSESPKPGEDGEAAALPEPAQGLDPTVQPDPELLSSNPYEPATGIPTDEDAQSE